MSSEIKADKWSPASGTSATIGDSGDTYTIPSGVNFTNNGTATGFGITAANFRPNANPLIINGDMAVAQRGTSTASITSSGYYTADRIRFGVSSFGTWTSTQESLTSGNAYTDGFSNAFKIDCTTANASPGASVSITIGQKFEGQDLQLLKKGTANAEKITVAFWIKATKTGTFIAELYDHDNTRSCSKAYTVSSSNTWEHKVINFPADTTGTLDDDNANSLTLFLWQGAGSSFTSGTLNTSWASATNANRAVGQVNNADSTSNNVHITGLQMEVGEYTSSTLPPFQHESFGDNLARCQRYFQMRAEGNQKIISMAHWGSGTEVDFIMQIPFMRTRPSLEYTTGNEYYAIGGGGSTNTLDNLNMNSWSTEMNINLWTTTGAGGTVGFAYYGYTNNASAKLGFTAEL